MRRVSQCTHDCTLRQCYFETVVAQRLCALKQRLRGLIEQRLGRHLANQQAFHTRVAPWFVRYTAQRQAGVLNYIAIQAQGRSDRHQRKRVGGSISNFQVAVMLFEQRRRQLYSCYQLIGCQLVITLRIILG